MFDVESGQLRPISTIEDNQRAITQKFLKRFGWLLNFAEPLSIQTSSQSLVNIG